MILKNIKSNYNLILAKGVIYQSTVNNQLYTLVNPCNLLRYFPPTDTWIEVSVDEILKVLTNSQYLEYQSNKSDNYVECSFEEASLITNSGVGYAYVKLLNRYLPLKALKESVDSSTSLKFYKNKFARLYCDIDNLEEENLVIPLNNPYDDIYY